MNSYMNQVPIAPQSGEWSTIMSAYPSARDLSGSVASSSSGAAASIEAAALMIPPAVSEPPPVKRKQTAYTDDQQKTLWGAVAQHKPHLAAAGTMTSAAWEQVYETVKAHPFFSGVIIPGRSVLEQKFVNAKKTLAKKIGQCSNTSGFHGDLPEHLKILREIAEAEEAHDEVISINREANKAKEAKVVAAKTKTGLLYGCIEGPETDDVDGELDSEGVEGEIIERDQNERELKRHRVRRSSGASSMTSTPSSGGTAPLGPNDGDFGSIGASLEKVN